jgi:uncharacterized protein involved in exopolysaccharide biosynthesis
MAVATGNASEIQAWPADPSASIAMWVRAAWRQKWLITGLALVGAALAAVLAFTSPDIYRATTTVVPAGANKGLSGLGGALGEFSGLASLAGIEIGGEDSVTEEALAVLKAREFLRPMLEEHKLAGRVCRSSLFGLRGRTQSIARDHRCFVENLLVVSRDRRTGLIDLGIRWTDRNESAAWTNELVARVNREMRARALARTDSAIEFLEKEQARSRFVETQNAISRLIEAQVKQRMIATVSPEYAFRVVERAVTPDKDDTVGLSRLLRILVGLVLGGCLGVGSALVRAALKPALLQSKQQPLDTSGRG